jgi:hypothetical protein
LRAPLATARRAAVIGIVAACGLAGCSSDVFDLEHARRISQERTALLKRQPPPSCEYRTASLDKAAKRGNEPMAATSDAPPDATILQARLDYERQCYRHAEMIARARLTSLQMALDRLLKRAEMASRTDQGARSAPSPR